MMQNWLAAQLVVIIMIFVGKHHHDLSNFCAVYHRRPSLFSGQTEQFWSVATANRAAICEWLANVNSGLEQGMA